MAQTAGTAGASGATSDNYLQEVTVSDLFTHAQLKASHPNLELLTLSKFWELSKGMWRSDRKYTYFGTEDQEFRPTQQMDLVTFFSVEATGEYSYEIRFGPAITDMNRTLSFKFDPAYAVISEHQQRFHKDLLFESDSSYLGPDPVTRRAVPLPQGFDILTRVDPDTEKQTDFCESIWFPQMTYGDYACPQEFASHRYDIRLRQNIGRRADGTVSMVGHYHEARIG